MVIFLSDAKEMQKKGAYDQVCNTFLTEGFIWCEPTETHYTPVSGLDTHPNEETNKFYADALFKTLLEGELLSRNHAETVVKWRD